MTGSASANADLLRRAQDICSEAEDKAAAANRRAERAEGRVEKAEARAARSDTEARCLEKELKVDRLRTSFGSTGMCSQVQGPDSMAKG